MVAGVARDGRILYRRAAGHADREAGRAMAVDTPFRLASVTKPLVSAAGLALAERGTIDLDAPGTGWFPDFRPRFDGGAGVNPVRHPPTPPPGLGPGFFQEPGRPLERKSP